ncbi:MAG TPA: enhanced serine sensitivity protein SseB C-terminal domain-containing protein [Candidatus Angelobacter sp.]|nr:enhanced serine sensitivity protein SseB C-terminal domain-containing protein [Candidatus Angelobacter sp.]
MKWLTRLLSPKPKDGPKIDNSQLVQAMHELALADTPQKREKLYRLLLDAVIVMPTPEIPSGMKLNVANQMTGTTKIEVTGLRGKENQRITPIFTDFEALRNWDPNTPCLAVPARAFFEMIVKLNFDEVIVNPFDPIRKMLRPGGVLKRFEFAALADGVLPGPPDVSNSFKPMTIAKDQNVFIGIPAAPPPETVLNAVIAAAKAMPEVKELYLFQMIMESGQASIAVGIDLTKKIDPEERLKIVRGLTAAIHGLLDKDKYLDFMVMESSFAETIRQSGKRLLHP